MGVYLNPKDCGFADERSRRIYVDKSEMIRYTNSLIRTGENKLCVTRPRRFGKTIDLKMLTAYYSRGCDSRALFQDLKIAQDPSFSVHLNKHNVIRMDMQLVWEAAIHGNKGDQLVQTIQDRIIKELVAAFPGIQPFGNSLTDVMIAIHANNDDTRFIFLLDEWDAVLRDTTVTQAFKKDYLSLLSSLFKGPEIESCLDLVYMTGILPPIKYLKDTRNQSWLNNFTEYSMLNPGEMAEFVGFTEEEVSDLCKQWNMPMDAIKKWYDGYQLDDVGSIYCPESVCKALTRRKIGNFWAGTSSFKVISEQLRGGLPGLKSALDSLAADEPVSIDPSHFENNVNDIRSKDDVLALLVHYGYLTCFTDGIETEVKIPNSEVRGEFAKAIEDAEAEEYRELQKIINNSKRLLESTWNGEEEEVAKQIQEVHNYKASALRYNSEEALRSVINLAYFSADAYYQMVQEFPSGKGFVDIAFLPKHSKYIPMILELKWNKSAKTALDQIKERNYQGNLRLYKKILLVGIAYEKGTRKDGGKEHTCKIELWEDSEP